MSKDKIKELVEIGAEKYELGTMEFQNRSELNLNEFWLFESTEDEDEGKQIRGNGTSPYSFQVIELGDISNYNNNNFSFQIFSVTKQRVKELVYRNLELNGLINSKTTDKDIQYLYGEYEKGGFAVGVITHELKFRFYISSTHFKKIEENIKNKSLNNLFLNINFLNVYYNRKLKNDKPILFIDDSGAANNLAVGVVRNLMLISNQSKKNVNDKITKNSNKSEKNYHKPLFLIIVILLLILIFK